MDNNNRPGDRFQTNRRSRYDDRDRDRPHGNQRMDRDRDRDRGGYRYGHGHGHNGDRHNGDRRLRDSRRTSSKPNLRDLPLEQGRIHTLLDNFGFIYCAERTTDLFFHYSEVGGVHSNDLNCGDEVQFTVGPRSTRGGRDRGGGIGADNSEEKLSAYSVSILEPGTVQWETEVDPVGVRRLGRVERMVRFQSRDRDRDNGSSEGTIRLEVDIDDDRPDATATASTSTSTSKSSGAKGEKAQEDQKEGVEKDDASKGLKIDCGIDGSPKRKKGKTVKYTVNDYSGFRSKSRSDFLERKDLVEFTLVTDKRSGLLYAREITMVQSERERLEQEREKEMLKHATLEQGIVVSLKNGFGFLRSNKRREEIYFHFSQIQLPDEGESDGQHQNDDGVDGDDEGQLHTLKEGQDMEFLVVCESLSNERDNGTSRAGKKKLGARQVKFLPRGTVVFEQTIATGVTGVLSMVPRFFNNHNSSRRGGKRSGSEGFGKVRLCDTIEFVPLGNDESNTLEVNEVSLDFKDFMKDEPKHECWLKVGDTLFFDVVRDVIDGICRVAPTKYSPEEHLEESTDKGRIRLVTPSLAGRAEGVVTSIKDNYGFIQLAHRNVDVYFRLSEIFPLRIQQGLMNSNDQNQEAHPNLIVGSEVTFDLSLLPPKSRPNRNVGRHGKRGGEKEQLRAQRLAILPPGSLILTKEVEATGFVTRILKNSFTGQIRLDKKFTAMTEKEQYPLITKLISNFNSNKTESILNFLEVQSEYENDVITEITRGYHGLELNFIPVAEFGGDHRGRICIRKVQQKCSKVTTTKTTEDREIAELVSENLNESMNDSEVNANEEHDTTQIIEEIDDEEEIADSTTENGKSEGSLESQRSPKKNSRKKTRNIRSITFDRQSLSSEFVADPPINGDKVSMTVTYSRSTEKFNVSNMVLLERNEPIIKTTCMQYNMCEGFVLLEPVHTAFKESKSKRRGFEGGGWGSEEKVEGDGKSNDDGIILLLSDPASLYKTNDNFQNPAEDLVEENIAIQTTPPSINAPESESSKEEEESGERKEQNDHIGQHISYTTSARSIGNRNAEIPKRGDLVTFTRGKNGKAKDVRIKAKSAAKRLEGKLIETQSDSETPLFKASVEDKIYDVKLKEVVSCECKVLKKDDAIEAIIHEGKLVGICRKADLYLATAISGGSKERPRLNLTVKKELKGLGGKIIAQSCMAKGPDGTLGFISGWTSRTSRFASQDTAVDENVDEVESKPITTALNKDAEPFVL